MVSKIRNIAINIIEEFEELLSKHNINIPSQDREGNKGEACLYGSAYYELEDSITELLKNEFKQWIDDDNKEFKQLTTHNNTNKTEGE